MKDKGRGDRQRVTSQERLNCREFLKNRSAAYKLPPGKRPLQTGSDPSAVGAQLFQLLEGAAWGGKVSAGRQRGSPGAVSRLCGPPPPAPQVLDGDLRGCFPDGKPWLLIPSPEPSLLLLFACLLV